MDSLLFLLLPSLVFVGITTGFEAVAGGGESRFKSIVDVGVFSCLLAVLGAVRSTTEADIVALSSHFVYTIGARDECICDRGTIILTRPNPNPITPYKQLLCFAVGRSRKVF